MDGYNIVTYSRNYILTACVLIDVLDEGLKTSN